MAVEVPKEVILIPAMCFFAAMKGEKSWGLWWPKLQNTRWGPKNVSDSWGLFKKLHQKSFAEHGNWWNNLSRVDQSEPTETYSQGKIFCTCLAAMVRAWEFQLSILQRLDTCRAHWEIQQGISFHHETSPCVRRLDVFMLVNCHIT